MEQKNNRILYNKNYKLGKVFKLNNLVKKLFMENHIINIINKNDTKQHKATSAT